MFKFFWWQHDAMGWLKTRWALLDLWLFSHAKPTPLAMPNSLAGEADWRISNTVFQHHWQSPMADHSCLDNLQCMSDHQLLGSLAPMKILTVSICLFLTDSTHIILYLHMPRSKHLTCILMASQLIWLHCGASQLDQLTQLRKDAKVFDFHNQSIPTSFTVHFPLGLQQSKDQLVSLTISP